MDNLSNLRSRGKQAMGLTNVIPIIPFCRSPDEGHQVLAEMAKHELVEGERGLQVYVGELPRNVMFAAEFSEVFENQLTNNK